MNGNVDYDVLTSRELTNAGIKDGAAHAQKPTLAELDASKLIVTKTTTVRAVPVPNSKEVWSFKECTDHMVRVTYTDSHGWHAPEIVPYGPLMIMPTASCLHYATQCFEGMKVYRGYDGKLRLFRPDLNAKRLAMSSTRVALPTFDPEEFVKILHAFLAVDGPRWLPESRPGTFLYVRPAIIGNGEQLGVIAPAETLLFIIATPWPDISGDAVPPGAASKPYGLKLLASKGDTRAWPGGFGYAKVGANYGPTFVSHMEGRRRGYDQILWLLNTEKEFEVTEAGASNFFVVWKTKEGKTELVTAPLGSKIILDGITRRSVLELASKRLIEGSKYLEESAGIVDVVERAFTMLEIEEAYREGRLMEAFVSGTAYFITPVSAINFKDEDLEISMGSKGQGGTYATLIKKWLIDIKYGNEQHEWGVVVEEN
ncbi:aminotransferase [Calycina marina]|uniref:Branched-chain-amino-acid aminotransferase n=1 Tax=Calycina marina TaxID=1763456 RepID=A0A9P8CIY3_9HELO|nr:aminotransferase [Calycina marina]